MIREVSKIDNQSIMNGYLHSMKVSAIFDTEQGNPASESCSTRQRTTVGAMTM